MNLSITYSVKFRSFGITFGTIKGSFNSKIPIQQDSIEGVVETAALSKVGLISGWTKSFSSNGIDLVVVLT